MKSLLEKLLSFLKKNIVITFISFVISITFIFFIGWIKALLICIMLVLLFAYFIKKKKISISVNTNFLKVNVILPLVLGFISSFIVNLVYPGLQDNIYSEVINIKNILTESNIKDKHHFKIDYEISRIQNFTYDPSTATFLIKTISEDSEYKEYLKKEISDRLLSSEDQLTKCYGFMILMFSNEGEKYKRKFIDGLNAKTWTLFSIYS